MRPSDSRLRYTSWSAFQDGSGGLPISLKTSGASDMGYSPSWAMQRSQGALNTVNSHDDDAASTDSMALGSGEVMRRRVV